jgi:hypothetical protein
MPHSDAASPPALSQAYPSHSQPFPSLSDDQVYQHDPASIHFMGPLHPHWVDGGGGRGGARPSEQALAYICHRSRLRRPGSD